MPYNEAIGVLLDGLFPKSNVNNAESQQNFRLLPFIILTIVYTCFFFDY
jgi:hypothetical protein